MSAEKAFRSVQMEPVQKGRNASGECSDQEGDTDDDCGKDVDAPVGACEIAAVDVPFRDAEDDQEDEADDRNSKQDLKAEIGPRGNRRILAGGTIIHSEPPKRCFSFFPSIHPEIPSVKSPLFLFTSSCILALAFSVDVVYI